MDVLAKAGMRACWIGAAAAGLIGPGFLDAQTARPAEQPVSRQSSQRRSAVKPTGTQPTASRVTPAGYETSGAGDRVAQSEVEQRLRELYERDGREMPDLSLSPSSTGRQPVTPVAPPAAANQSQTGAPRTIPVSQSRTMSPAPVPPQSKPPASSNKVTSFFKKLLPGGNKKAQAQTPPVPPRQLPAAAQQPMPQPNQPVSQNQYNAAVPIQPQQVAPQPAVQQPATTPRFAPQPPVILQPPAVPGVSAIAVIPPSPAAAAQSSVAFGNPVGGIDSALMPPAEAEDLDLLDLPAPAAEVQAAPQISEPEMTADDDDEDEDEDIPPPVIPAAPKLAEDEFDPFGERTPEPEAPMEDASPFTGKALEGEVAPPAPKTGEPTILPPAAIEEEPVDESTAAKMRRIIQRADMKGLKGFCPVTLRDQRELADSRPEFAGTYRGQKFYFASKPALEKFEKDPARYAPAAYGADVVVLTNDQDVIEGTLDYAAWYKGRLYLFGSEKTHDLFVETPEKYATPPGIE